MKLSIVIDKIEDFNSYVIMISFTDFYVSNKDELKGIATNISPVKEQKMYSSS